MEKVIDRNDIDGQLEHEFLRVFNAYRNRKARKNFLELTKDLKPKSCEVKIGWVAGEYISFACKFYKNGEGDIFKEIVKGWQNKVEDLYFLYGLYPDVFHFNPKFYYDSPEYITICFKFEKEGLKENGKRKKT